MGCEVPGWVESRIAKRLGCSGCGSEAWTCRNGMRSWCRLAQAATADTSA
ncbi:hypothetical protein SynWH8101_2188 [Synechococcus sp. WH 8101]|nr:hypothetical protein SynWH8101_2188 [Synechococcus sp. WH 8101]